jgi:hypothetical protein
MMKQKKSRTLHAVLMAVAAVTLVVASPGRPALAQGEPASTASLKPPGNDVVDDLMSGAKAGAVLRTVSFSRSKPNNKGPSAEAIGAGGWLFGETGEIAQTLSFGGAVYGVAPVSGPAGHGGNFVLKDPNQDGYVMIGEAWGRLRFGDQAVTAGRVSPNLGWYLDGVYRFNRNDSAFLGRRDFRAMLPLSYEAAIATGKLAQDTVRYYGGYVWEMRQVNQNTFKNLATGALIPGDSDGMAFAGGGWKINNDLMLQGAYHAVDNVMNIGWADLDYMFRIAKDKYVRFDVQYISQNSNGNSGLGNFSTSSAAAYVEGRWWPSWIPYGIVGRTGDGDNLRSPYSLGPSYLIQRVGENAWAGEHTWILGSTFDFATYGAPGLTFDVNYGQRTDRHLPGDTSKPLADWTEAATDLVYTFGKDAGLASGLRLRARWARVWEEGNQYSGGRITAISQQMTDIRFDVHWLIQFK